MAGECCDKAYWCPSSNSDECGVHGGFSTCCGSPQLHTSLNGPRPKLTKRGFLHCPTYQSTYGGTVRVYESSNASGPHIWVTVVQPKDLNNPEASNLIDASAHLPLDDAIKLRADLDFLIAHHYQNEERYAEGRSS